MEIVKVVFIAIITLFIILTLGKDRQDFAIIISIIAGIFILIFCISKISPIISLLNNLAEKAGVNKEFFKIILKATLIAYIVELARMICKDANQNGLSEKLEIAGKIVIISISIPVITSLLNLISDMMVLL